MKVCPTCQKEYENDEMEFCPDDGMKLRLRREVRQDPLIGQLLDDRWLVEEKIGEGGMGSVYAAIQRSVNRKVAVKTLRRQLNDNEEFVDRFFREADIATRIQDPHCVTIYDFGQTRDEHCFLVMEFLEGETLHDRMRRGRLSTPELLRLGAQLAGALQAAHDVQIIHRDLKPENIFLLDRSSGDLFIKVLDFGIAKMLDAEKQYTQTGQVFGTPQYMSPEQCEGAELDGRSDLYSVGCILYEALAGHSPFHESKSVGLLVAHLNQPPPPLDVKALDISDALERIIMKLLAKNREDRYASGNDLKHDLEEELARYEGTQALRRSRVLDAQRAASEAEGWDDSFTHTSSSAPGKLPIIAGVLIALTLVAAGGWFATRGKQAPTPPPQTLTTRAVSPPASTAATPKPTAEVTSEVTPPPAEVKPDPPKTDVVDPPAVKPAVDAQPTTDVAAKVEPKPVVTKPTADSKPVTTRRKTTSRTLTRRTTTSEPAPKPTSELPPKKLDTAPKPAPKTKPKPAPKTKPKPAPKTKKDDQFMNLLGAGN